MSFVVTVICHKMAVEVRFSLTTPILIRSPIPILWFWTSTVIVLKYFQLLDDKLMELSGVEPDHGINPGPRQ